MFSYGDNPSLARRPLGVLRLIRSFLLLEDDHDVDWEVTGNEPTMDRTGCREAAWEGPDHDHHPHRLELRGRRVPRRAGQPAPREHICLCPVQHPARHRASLEDARHENAL